MSVVASCAARVSSAVVVAVVADADVAEVAGLALGLAAGGVAGDEGGAAQRGLMRMARSATTVVTDKFLTPVACRCSYLLFLNFVAISVGLFGNG